MTAAGWASNYEKSRWRRVEHHASEGMYDESAAWRPMRGAAHVDCGGTPPTQQFSHLGMPSMFRNTVVAGGYGTKLQVSSGRTYAQCPAAHLIPFAIYAKFLHQRHP